MTFKMPEDATEEQKQKLLDAYMWNEIFEAKAQAGDEKMRKFLDDLKKETIEHRVGMWYWRRWRKWPRWVFRIGDYGIELRWSPERWDDSWWVRRGLKPFRAQLGKDKLARTRYYGWLNVSIGICAVPPLLGAEEIDHWKARLNKQRKISEKRGFFAKIRRFMRKNVAFWRFSDENH
jgi:hypothetical protein